VGHGLPRSALLAGLLTASIVGCAGAASPLPRSMPDDSGQRDALVAELGRAAWTALADGDPLRLLAGEDILSLLLEPHAVARLLDRRPGLRARLGEVVHRIPAQLASATYLGVCALDARDEGPGGPLGLRGATWTLRRILVAGRIAGTSRRIASWIDGHFAFDGTRLVALELEAIEAPRWEHSDLELARCDVSEGL
jgi:hypothetical protein